MKIILSILLSFIFFLSGIQITNQVQAKGTISEKKTKSKKKKNVLGYKILSSNVPQFEKAPILIQGVDYSTDEHNQVMAYVGKVDGKYGAINDSQEVIVPFEYDEFYPATSNFMKQDGKKIVVHYLFDFDGSRHNEYEESDFSTLNCSKYMCLGAGIYRSFEIKDDGENLNAWYHEAMVGTGATSEGLVREYYEDNKEWIDSTDMQIAQVEGNKNEYYLFNLHGDVFGPYDIKEWANYNVSQILETQRLAENTNSNMGDGYFGGINGTSIVFPVTGSFYCHEKGSYSVYSMGGIKKCDQLFDETYHISYKSTKVKKDDKVGIVNENADLVFLEEFDDVSDYINNRFYAKKNNKWYLLELKDQPKPATYVVNTDVVKGVYLHTDPDKDDKNNRTELLMPGDTAQITEIIENSDCKWGKTVEDQYVCIFEPTSEKGDSSGEYMSLVK